VQIPHAEPSVAAAAPTVGIGSTPGAIQGYPVGTGKDGSGYFGTIGFGQCTEIRMDFPNKIEQKSNIAAFSQ
jgi:hypothetical protein